jgi:4-alpha-glucanotransferase
MARHEVRRLYVGQYEVQPDPNRPFSPASPGAVASMNTHDMPTFAAFWRGLDIKDRKAMGLFDEAGARKEKERRRLTREAVIGCLKKAGYLGKDATEAAVLRGCLQYIAAGEAGFVLANLEDLWQETEPQNVPGTWREKPNWRLRAAHALEEFDRLPGLRDALRAVDKVMRGKGA